MSKVEQPTDVIDGYSLSLQEVAVVLIKHYDLHEGVYDTAIEFQLGFGRVGPDPDKPIPGAMIGVSRIGLAKVDAPGPNSVDAAVVNPQKKKRERKSG